jgi:hypothetical protein
MQTDLCTQSHMLLNHRGCIINPSNTIFYLGNLLTRRGTTMSSSCALRLDGEAWVLYLCLRCSWSSALPLFVPCMLVRSTSCWMIHWVLWWASLPVCSYATLVLIFGTGQSYLPVLYERLFHGPLMANRTAVCLSFTTIRRGVRSVRRS